MRRLIIAALAAALICAPSFAEARSSSSHSSHSSSHAGSHARSGGHSAGHGHAKATGVARDSHGHIARSRHAKDEFRKSNPCPSTGKTRGACPGYVVDHVQALKHGGADAPYNMQWQTREAARIKDRTE